MARWRRATGSSRSLFGLAARLVVALALVLLLGFFGYLAIVLGPDLPNLEFSELLTGERRVLGPAEIRGAPLRTAQGGADRVYVLTTQSERIVPILSMFRRRMRARPRHMMHVDLWAFDAATARPAWRRRLRTFEDRQPLLFEILGADGPTLWLFVREPIGVTLDEGSVVADGARIDAANPAMAGKHVNQQGYVAFGGQGLQLTLSDTTQWIVAGDGLAAQPREAAPKQRAGIVVPALVGSSTDRFQERGLPLGTMWLGVLTDEEAATLQRPPEVPGAKPGERRGVMADFLERQHVPGDLTVQPRPYRLWSAKVAKVSAAPPGWSKELPDNWGTREQFSDYAALPEAPVFLQAGLLGDGRGKLPFWFREPDSVVVLHHDRVGGAGRLRLARVSGPAGRVVWDAALPLATLEASMHGTQHLVFIGREPNPAHDPTSETSRATHERLVAVDVASGAVAGCDLTEESLREGGPIRTE